MLAHKFSPTPMECKMKSPNLHSIRPENEVGTELTRIITLCGNSKWNIEKNVHIYSNRVRHYVSNVQIIVNTFTLFNLRVHNVTEYTVIFLHLGLILRALSLVWQTNCSIKKTTNHNSTESHDRPYTKWIFYFTNCWHRHRRVHMYCCTSKSLTHTECVRYSYIPATSQPHKWYSPH